MRNDDDNHNVPVRVVELCFSFLILVILIFKKCRRFLLLGSFAVSMFACIFIGNLISLFSASLRASFISQMFRSQAKVESGKMFMQSLCFFGSARQGRAKKKKKSKFIKHKFIRLSRKKEINFHKFESQIKLREAQKESRGSCAVWNLILASLLLPPARLSSLDFCGLRVMIEKRSQRKRHFYIFHRRNLKWKLNDLGPWGAMAVTSRWIFIWRILKADEVDWINNQARGRGWLDY